MSYTETKPPESIPPSVQGLYLTILYGLWPTGAISLIFLIAYFLNGLDSETAEWRIYMILGMGTPVLLTLLLYLDSKGHTADVVSGGYRFLSIFALAAMGFLMVLLSVYTSFYAAPFLGGICALPYAIHNRKNASWYMALFIAFLSTLSWLGAGKMLYWSSLTDTLSASTYTLFICLVGIVCITWLIHPEWTIQLLKTRPIPPSLVHIGRWMGHWAVLVLLAWPSFRTDFFTDPNALHHWSHWIGPAESVREGGWLLWDVPSQYGFLSILSIAVLPVSTAWQALYLIQSVTVWIVAILVYIVFQRNRKGFLNGIFSCCMALAAVCFMSGAKDLIGPQLVVSVGPMRFVWCHVLLFLVWLFLLRPHPSLRLFRWLGSIAWLIGVLWSAESAVYSTAVFGAASFILAVQAIMEARKNGENWRTAPGRFLPYALTPLFLLFLALTAITLYYRVYLGTGPDWYAYIDYVVTYVGGQCALPIEATGPVWVLFMAFCIVSTMMAEQAHKDAFSPRLAALAGFWGATWAVSSYFVSRSHPNNVNNLMPVICMIFGMLLKKTTNKADIFFAPGHTLSCHALLPILGVVLLSTIGNPSLMGFIQQTQHPFTEVTTDFPLLSPSTRAMLDRNQVTLDQPLAYNHLGIMLPMGRLREKAPRKTMLPTQTFLPKPLILLDGLSPERRIVFFKRHLARHPQGGWLILPKELKGIDAWLAEALPSLFTLQKVDEDAYDILYRCTLRPSP